METILLPVDGSVHAVRATQYVAKLGHQPKDIEVTLLNIQPPIYDWQMHGVTREHIAKHHAEAAGKVLAAADQTLAAIGIHAQLEYRHADDAAQMIVQVAREKHTTLIVMGSRGLGAIANLAMGSVAQKVLHLSHVPVLIVK